MIINWMVAAIHLLALGIGLGAIWTRSRALKGLPNLVNLRRAFFADTLWAVAAVLWISTGLARAFGGLEKGSAYYLNNNAFWLKMALLILILLLEIWPMITLIRWRLQVSRGEEIDTRQANGFAMISVVQAGLVVAMVFVATAMARGIGA
jgi:putative membrane protein